MDSPISYGNRSYSTKFRDSFRGGFRGSRILYAAIKALVERGVTKSDHFILGGCSAGARGALSHLDLVSSSSSYTPVPIPSDDDSSGGKYGILLPDGIEVSGFLDSPLWIDLDPISKESVSLLERIRRLSVMADISFSYGKRCEEATQPEEVHRCAFGEHRLRFLQTPYFLIQNQLDSYQLKVLGAATDKYGDFSAPWLRIALANRTRKATTFEPSSSKSNRNGFKDTFPPYGLFSPACEKHCLSLHSSFTKVNINGTTVKDAYVLWQTHLKKNMIGRNHSSPYNNVAIKMRWVDNCDGPSECGGGCVTYKSSGKKKKNDKKTIERVLKKGRGTTGKRMEETRNKMKRGKRSSKVALTLGNDTLSRIEANYVCVNLDWWPKSKCDYGTCPWSGASVLHLDLTTPGLEDALQMLGGAPAQKAASGVRLRIGGSLSDLVHYTQLSSSSTGKESCPPDFKGDNHTRIGYDLAGACLPWKRWTQIAYFCKRVNCELIFMINALRGRKKIECPEKIDCRHNFKRNPCCTAWQKGSNWNSTNALEFLKKVAHAASINNNSPRIFGFEFGNELAGRKGIQAHLTPQNYGDGFLELKRMVDDLWGNVVEEVRPKIIGPNSAFQEKWNSEFLRYISDHGEKVDILTSHMYTLGAGVSPKVPKFMLMPTKLDHLKAKAETAARVVSAYGGSTTALWVGEAGGAYNSGRANATDAFISAFWFNHNLATLATAGYQAFCRQTLLGGHYGLLRLVPDIHKNEQKRRQRTNRGNELPKPRLRAVPNPDFYSAVIWNRIIGTRVLKVELNMIKAPGGEKLRGWGFCMQGREGGDQGGVVLLLINYSEDSEVQVILPPQDIAPWAHTERVDYVLGPHKGDLYSKELELNDRLVELEAAGKKIPDIISRGVKVGAGAPLRLKNLTVAFITFPRAQYHTCIDAKNKSAHSSSGSNSNSNQDHSNRHLESSEWLFTEAYTMVAMMLLGFLLACAVIEVFRRHRRRHLNRLRASSILIPLSEEEEGEEGVGHTLSVFSRDVTQTSTSSVARRRTSPLRQGNEEIG